VVISSITWIDLVSIIVLPVLLPSAIGYFTNTAVIPTFWKRLILFLLAFATTALTELLDAIAAGNPYDLGMAFLRSLATYLLAEGAYQKFLKAPIITIPSTATDVIVPADPQALTVRELKALLPSDAYPAKATKADLIALIPEAEIKPIEIKSIASVIQAHGVGSKS
jgi:hypothetical protein